MKRSFVIILILALMFSVCGCSKTNAAKNADVTLTFIYGEENIRVTLEEDEAEKVISILDGNDYDPITSGFPSCSFDKNVSLQVGTRVFAIACDTCNSIQDLGNLRYFSVSKDDMEYIHSLFKNTAGISPAFEKAPCLCASRTHNR